MKYIKLENDKPIEYSIEQLLIDYPDAIIYKYSSELPNEKLLANYNVYPLVTTKAVTGKYEVFVGEGTPIYKDNEWHQTWVNRPMTEEEILELQKEEEILSYIDFLENEID